MRRRDRFVRGLIAGAGVLLALFAALHLAGGRAYTNVLSGASAAGITSSSRTFP